MGEWPGVYLYQVFNFLVDLPVIFILCIWSLIGII